MAGKVKRAKTKHTGIYYNESTQKYDVKYNYKVYNPDTQKNDYKQKWKYGIPTVKEAKSELAKLQNGGVPAAGRDITLEGAHQLWVSKAGHQDYSPKSLKNTAAYLKMLYQFIPKETKMKDITADMYEDVMDNVKKHGYSDETVRDINATFRKLINLCYQKKLVDTNILEFADNIRTKNKDDYRVIPKEEFDKLSGYFQGHKSARHGNNNYPKYRLMFSLLYYTGIRLGECLALQYDDFEFVSNFKKGEEPEDKILLDFPDRKDMDREHLIGTQVKITKEYLSDLKIIKEPKNYKKRAIILDPEAVRLFQKAEAAHLQKGGAASDRIFTWGHGACNNMLQRACRKLGLPRYHCHDFRHTYISNLILQGIPLPLVSKMSGDTQETILKRYSHVGEQDMSTVLKAMSNL